MLSSLQIAALAGSRSRLLEVFETIGREMPVVLPLHPRTQQNMTAFGLDYRVEAKQYRAGVPWVTVDGSGRPCTPLSRRSAF